MVRTTGCHSFTPLSGSRDNTSVPASIVSIGCGPDSVSTSVPATKQLPGIRHAAPTQAPGAPVSPPDASNGGALPCSPHAGAASPRKRLAADETAHLKSVLSRLLAAIPAMATRTATTRYSTVETP